MNGWDGDPAVYAYVVDDLVQSIPYSVEIVNYSDLVHEFEGYCCGQWVFTAWQYITEDFSGTTFFILMNCTHGTSTKCAVQIQFDSVTQTAVRIIEKSTNLFFLYFIYISDEVVVVK